MTQPEHPPTSRASRLLAPLTRLVLTLRLRLRTQAGGNDAGLDTMLLWAVLVGIAGGLCSALFRGANIGLKWLMTGQTQDIVAIAESLPPSLRVWVPTLGGFAAGLALWLGARIGKGPRSQDYLEVVRLGDGIIPIKPTLARLTSSLLSISSGSSIGREGGMVQFSALAASSIGRYCRFPRQRLRLLVACGGAAGLASAYNTPLASALFIAEIVLQTLAIEALGPLIVSALAATLVIRHWIGMQPIFTTPPFSMAIPLDILPVLGLGLLAGALAPAFLATLDTARGLFQRLRLPLPFRLALGGFIVGLISIRYPEVWGNGHAVTEYILTTSPARDFVFNLMLFKILATAAAVGTGTVGGVFTPTLMIGACTGWLYSQGILTLGLADFADPVTYTVLGMGAFLSGTTFAPVMAILMIFEMTLKADLLFPLIVVTVSARYFAAAIRPTSVYASSLGSARGQVPFLMQAEDLMTRPAAVVNTLASAQTVSEVFCRSTTQQVWVIDDAGRYQGVITLERMKLFLGDPSLRHLNAALVFMEDDIPPITPDTTLTEALTALVRHETDRLPIVDGDHQLLGEIAKNDILLALA